MQNDPSVATAEALVAAVSVFDIEAKLHDQGHLERLKNDLAQGIYPHAVIAARYGLSMEQLVVFLKRNPGFVAEVKKTKALWESGGNTAEAVRLEAQTGLREILPHLVADALDTKTTAATRVDIAKQVSRIAGVDGMPAPSAQGAPGKTGNQFVLNIQFTGREPEIITTTVVENELPPPPEQGDEEDA